MGYVTDMYKSGIWKYVISILVTIAALILLLTMEVSMQESIPDNHVIPEISIDPEIEILANYMKARMSTLPMELANIQAMAIVEVAKIKEFPTELIVGMVESESLFNPFSTSSKGAAGLMQILVEDGIEIDATKKYDIQYNLDKGCDILKSKLQKTNGDLYRALVNYSGGANGYTEKVYECAGRYAIFRSRFSDIKIVSK